MRFLFRFAALVAAMSLQAGALAKVARIEIGSVETVLEGRQWGEAGAYERLVGTVFFEFDPASPFNDRIVDLERAPRNERGMVEASATFMALRPADPARARGVALVEVSNRGSVATMRYFNGATRGGFDLTDPEHFGDGLLLRQGLSVVWIGWQCDVPDEPGRIRLEAPIATGPGGATITGLVRCDWTLNEAAQRLDLGHRGQTPYPVADRDDARNALTVRDGRLAPRRAVPRDAWRFSADGAAIESDAGFEAGKIYELVYVGRDPWVVGLGLAAVRDIMSHIRYDAASPVRADRGVAWGVSQTGRFLRHFLYEGFNTDEMGRPVYDGLLIHTAGAGRGSFNHRFAQPSRDAHRYSAFFYPTDIFPFSGRTQIDPVTHDSDGLFARAHDPLHVPKVMYTNTGYEYWGRSAALLHVTPAGDADAPPLPNERIYHLAGAQHFVGSFPPREEARIGDGPAYLGNPVNLLAPLRALLIALVEWVDEGVEPPASAVPTAVRGRHPSLERAVLVSPESLDFPQIPGVAVARMAQEAYRADYGPRWGEGIIDLQPPRLGPAFPVLVPSVDLLGNEEGGVPTVETLTPLATYTPWSLRLGLPGEQRELRDFVGMTIPLPLTEAEREAAGDPRPSVETLYTRRAKHQRAAERAAEWLVDAGLLLPEDAPRAVDRAGVMWDWMHRDR